MRFKKINTLERGFIVEIEVVIDTDTVFHI